MDRLLIIDDQVRVTQMLKRRLVKLGYFVETAHSRTEVLAILEKERFDLILTDYMMPEVSGYELFLETFELYKTPSIMMTAHSSLNLAIQFIKSGGVDFVEKPIDLSILDIKIQRAISNDRQLHREVVARKEAESKLLLAITELKEKTHHLEVANLELDAFTSSVSHDLKAPLRNIISFLGLFKKKLGNTNLDNEAWEFFNFVEDASHKMNKMITKLLDFSKIKGESDINTIIDTKVLIQSVVNSLKLDIEEYKAQVECDSLPQIKGDPILLTQVFFNLIQNGVKYSSKEDIPKVQVTAKEKENEVIFAIKDNGVGFDMALAAHLFDLFVRLPEHKSFEGTGVGLANVKRIVERHKGKVWATSTRGKGATFFFSLPK